MSNLEVSRPIFFLGSFVPHSSLPLRDVVPHLFSYWTSSYISPMFLHFLLSNIFCVCFILPHLYCYVFKFFFFFFWSVTLYYYIPSYKADTIISISSNSNWGLLRLLFRILIFSQHLAYINSGCNGGFNTACVLSRFVLISQLIFLFCTCQFLIFCQTFWIVVCCFLGVFLLQELFCVADAS